jgi:PKD repeat protein
VLVAGLLFAVSAGAVVVTGLGGARFGIEPLTSTAPSQSAGLLSASSGVFNLPIDTGLVVYHGGPVVHGLQTYAIFWDPKGVFQASTESLVSRYLSDVAHDSGATTNVFSVAGQYTDSQGGASYAQTFGGAFIDTTPYPTTGNCSQTTPTASTCLYDSQEASELQSFIASHNLPSGLGVLYFVLTPDTTVTCMDDSDSCSNNAFCSYHSYAGSGAQTVLYAAIPFTLLDSAGDAKSCQDDGYGTVQAPNGDPGFGGVAIKSMSHEEMETITDPLLSAWYFADGDEVSDACNGVFWNPNSFLPTQGGSAIAGTLFNETINGDHYYLQGAWSNATQSCELMTGLVASISAPTSAAPGATVTLSATASTNVSIPGSGYVWQFGDGQAATGSSVTHAYATSGTYTITLTVTDANGDSGTTTSQITVATNASTTSGTTAGASGSSKPKSKTTCGPGHVHGDTKTRLCTTTLTSYTTRQLCERSSTNGANTRSRSCRTVIVKTVRSQRCRLTNSTEAETVSARCSTVTVHRSIDTHSATRRSQPARS